MANNSARKISSYSACTAPNANDVLALVGNTSGVNTSFRVTVATLLGNSDANVVIQYSNSVSNSMTITAGTLLYDSNSLYIAIANDTVKKVADLSDF